MDYNKIVKQSLGIAWRNKTLWVFGMFAGSGTIGEISNFWKEDRNQYGIDFGELEHFFDEFMIAMIFAVSILMLAFLVMHIISKTALIDAVNNITRGGSYKFGKSFSIGLDYFWKMFGLVLAGLVAILGILIVLGIPLFIMFAIHVALGIFGVFIIIPIALILFFGFFNTFELASRALVTRNCSIGDAIHEGYQLLKYYKGKNLAIFLIYILVSFFSVILALMLGAVFVIPLAIAAYASGGIVFALITALPVFILFLMVVSGFIGSILSSMYTIFYFDLLEQQSIVQSPAA